MWRNVAVVIAIAIAVMALYMANRSREEARVALVEAVSVLTQAQQLTDAPRGDVVSNAINAANTIIAVLAARVGDRSGSGSWTAVIERDELRQAFESWCIGIQVEGNYTIIEVEESCADIGKTARPAPSGIKL